MLPVATVYPIALLAAVVLGRHGVARGASAGQVAARVLLALYLGWLIGATLFPLPLHHVASGQGFAAARNHPNIVPLAGIRATLDLPGVWPRVRLLGGNVLVFAPLGLLPPTIWPRFNGVWHTALAGLAVSLSIELTQFAVSLSAGRWYRMSDIDDVMLNTAGLLLGYGLCRALGGNRFAAPVSPRVTPVTPRDRPRKPSLLTRLYSSSLRILSPGVTGVTRYTARRWRLGIGRVDQKDRAATKSLLV